MTDSQCQQYQSCEDEMITDPVARSADGAKMLVLDTSSSELSDGGALIHLSRSRLHSNTKHSSQRIHSRAPEMLRLFQFAFPANEDSRFLEKAGMARQEFP